MRQRLAQFMAGRNGNDQFNVFLLVIDIILVLAGTIAGGKAGAVIYIVVLALLVYIYFRMFSRNLYRRREENGKFMRVKYKVSAWLRLRHERWVQRKDYKFFTCPNCKTALRVPRGHGKVNIVCRKCGTSFTGKT